MHVISTSIVIAAPADKIWDVLVDFDKYPDWNPMFKKGTGLVSVDQTVALSVRSQNLTIKPKLIVASPGQELRWLGGAPIPGLFTGEHHHIITDNNDGTCTFDQGEVMSGCLVYLLGFTSFLETAEKGFIKLNKALKVRCEETTPSNYYTSGKSAKRSSKKKD